MNAVSLDKWYCILGVQAIGYDLICGRCVSASNITFSASSGKGIAYSTYKSLLIALLRSRGLRIERDDNDRNKVCSHCSTFLRQQRPNRPNVKRAPVSDELLF